MIFFVSYRSARRDGLTLLGKATNLILPTKKYTTRSGCVCWQVAQRIFINSRTLTCMIQQAVQMPDREREIFIYPFVGLSVVFFSYLLPFLPSRILSEDGLLWHREGMRKSRSKKHTCKWAEGSCAGVAIEVWEKKEERYLTSTVYEDGERISNVCRDAAVGTCRVRLDRVRLYSHSPRWMIVPFHLAHNDSERSRERGEKNNMTWYESNT